MMRTQLRCTWSCRALFGMRCSVTDLEHVFAPAVYDKSLPALFLASIT
jgi:hypothetical protein